MSDGPLKKAIHGIFPTRNRKNAVSRFFQFQPVENGGASLCRTQAVEKPFFQRPAGNIRSIRFLVAALSIGLATSALAWTSYGPGPQVQNPYANPPWDSVPPAPTFPNYGRQAPIPGPGGQVPREPSNFRISRATNDDAYTLTIMLDGMDPQEVRTRTQGHWLLLDRTHSVQHTQDQDLPEDRGFTRSFSYSSSTANFRYLIPQDGIPDAMSREDREDSIHISIPRRGGRQNTEKQ